MSKSTEVAVRKTPTAETVLAKRIEAHAIDTQNHVALAAAMVEVYARTEGLPLQPVQHWFFSTIGQPHLGATLATGHGAAVAHEKRGWLRDWADALGAEVTEARDYGSNVKLRAACVIGGVPVVVETDVNHFCTCTGQCNGGDL